MLHSTKIVVVSVGPIIVNVSLNKVPFELVAFSEQVSKSRAAEMRSLEIQDWQRAAQHGSSFSVWSHFHLYSAHSRGNLLFRQNVCVHVERRKCIRSDRLICIYGATTGEESQVQDWFCLLLGISITIQRAFLFFVFLLNRYSSMEDEWRKRRIYPTVGKFAMKHKVNNRNDKNGWYILSK